MGASVLASLWSPCSHWPTCLTFRQDHTGDNDHEKQDQGHKEAEILPGLVLGCLSPFPWGKPGQPPFPQGYTLSCPLRCLRQSAGNCRIPWGILGLLLDPPDREGSEKVGKKAHPSRIRSHGGEGQWDEEGLQEDSHLTYSLPLIYEGIRATQHPSFVEIKGP